MKKLKIGNIEISNPVFLAPMEKVTDVPFRSICRKLGADMVYTEFIDTRQINNNMNRLEHKMKIWDRERPVGIQVYSGDIKSIVKAAKKVAALNPDVIDLNFGCWVDGIVSQNAGAGMLRFPDKMVELARAVVDAVDIPVTLKTRLGWDDDSIVIDELAPQLEEAGIKALALHCRTREQGLRGRADWSRIANVKKYITIPLILNGDIKTPEDAKNAMETAGADGIMIGRAAIGNPFIFKRVRSLIDNGCDNIEISIRERIETCLEHLSMNIEYKGHAGLQEFRKHYAGYLRGLHESKLLHKQLVRMDNYDEISNELRSYAAKLLDEENTQQVHTDVTDQRMFSRDGLL